MTSREIAHIREGNFPQLFKRRLELFCAKLTMEIQSRDLLRSRVEEIRERIDCYEMNEHNFWVKKIPKQYLFHFVEAQRGDRYGEIDMSVTARDKIFSPGIVPFLDSIIEFGERDDCGYAISEKYEKCMDAELKSQAKLLPSRHCLCTIVNMGKIGEFPHQRFAEALDYAEQKYRLCGQPVTGMILSRGYENGAFVRRVEIQIPVEKYGEELWGGDGLSLFLANLRGEFYGREVEAAAAENTDGTIGVLLLNQSDREQCVHLRLNGFVTKVSLTAQSLTCVAFK